MNVTCSEINRSIIMMIEACAGCYGSRDGDLPKVGKSDDYKLYYLLENLFKRDNH